MMIKPQTFLAIITAASIMAACAEGNFSAGGLSQTKCKKGDNNCKPSTGKGGDLISTDGEGLCLKKAPAIDFILAMDVSGSMKPQSERVNAAFSNLAANLSNMTIEGLGKVPTVRFGLIAFEDVIQFESPMSSNFQSVKQMISEKFNAVFQGGDSSEAGLMAAARGLSLARNNKDSIKVMFLVTDAFSHDGTPTGAANAVRNYDPKDVLSVLSESDMRLTFIYTATPKTGGNKSPSPEPPFPNAVQQWESIRSTAASAGGRPQLGQDFDVSSFTADEVSESIPKNIANQLRKCL
jgi:hypothetical protein